MKTNEQVEKALAKYQQLLDENQRLHDFEDDFLKTHNFMQDKEAYVVAAIKWYESGLAVASCQRLIKNCKWILDIE